MAIGRPILISVTTLDETFYGRDKHPPSGPERFGPDADALSVEDALFRRGDDKMLPAVMLGTHARAQGAPTRDNVKDAIRAAGTASTGADDTVFVYYAGHGTRFPANTIGESPRDAFCLQDGFLLDVELVTLWKAFPETARVVFIADCCHAADAATGSWIMRLLRGLKKIAGINDKPRSMSDKRALAVAQGQPIVHEWYRQALLDSGDDPASVRCALLVLAATAPDEIILTPEGRSPFGRELRARVILSPDLPSYDALLADVGAALQSKSLHPGMAAAGREDLPFAFATPPFTVPNL